MKIGAAYVRVSTEDQIEFSPDSQIKKIKEYAKQNDIILPEEFVFIDEGISGKYAKKRPEFMKMIGTAKMKPKPFDVILVWKFSRFARNRQDSIVYKSMLRKDYNVDVVSITEQLSNDPTSILIEALLEAMDEYYSINLAQEVKRGMNEKFSRGGVVTAPPFGYIMGKNCFEIDEKNASIVKMIFNDFINGIPTRQIAIKLNSMGIRSKRGNTFENRTVEYILSNPVYIGKLRRNPNGKDKHDRFHRGEDVVVVDGPHSQLIDVETFENVQQMLLNLKKHYTKNARNTYTDFMLRGLVRCSNCGSTLTQAVKGKSLQCHKYARGQCNKSHSISLSKINEAVLKKLQLDLNEEELDISIKDIKDSSEKDISKILLDKEYKKLERIKLAYENGIDSIEEYKINKLKIQEHITQLEKQISKPALDKVSIQKTFKKRLKDAIGKLKSNKLSENEKNEILRSFIAKIVFKRDDCTIQIYYYE